MDGNQQLDQLDIFLSYASKDGLEFAQRLFEELPRASPRFAPWYDKRSRAEEQFDPLIEYKLSTADVVIVVRTRAFPDREWCRREILFALKMRRDIMVAQMHPDVAEQLSLIDRTPINFAADWEEGWARLVEQLQTYARPEHYARKLAQQVPFLDPESDLRHQAFARDVMERQQEESARAADPTGARRRTQDRIDAGLHRERDVSSDVRIEASMRFVNEIPVPAPTEFQDRVLKLEELKEALSDPTVRAIVLTGDGGNGKTSLIAEVRRRLAARKFAIEAAAFVYLAVGGYRQVSADTLLHDLSLLAPDPVLLRRRLREHLPVEAKLRPVLTALGSTSVVVAIDNFDDLLGEADVPRDGDLDLVIRTLMRDGHGIRLLLSAKRELLEWQRRYEPRVRPCGLKEGLPPAETRPFLASLDEDGLLDVEAIPRSEIDDLGVISHGIPRFIELVYCLLRSDPDLTLGGLLTDIDAACGAAKTPMPVLLQRLVSRLDRTEQRVVQALAVYGAPVRPEAVDFLLQEYVPGVDSAPVLKILEKRRLLRRDGDRYFLPPRPDAERILETVPPGSENDFTSLAPLYTQPWLLHRAADYFHEVSERANVPVIRVDDLQPQLSEIRLRIAAGGYRQALLLMEDIDTKYLTRWGQSSVLAPWLRELDGKDSLSLEQQAYITSALIAARHGEEDPTGSDTATLADLMQRLSRSEPFARILLRIQIGNRHLDDGRVTLAIGQYRVAARHSRLRSLRYEEGKARTNLGMSMARLGRFRLAEKELNRARKLLSSLEDDDSKQTLAVTLLDQGWLRGQLGDVDGAMKLLTRGLEIARDVRSYRLEGQLLDGQAALFCEKKDFESAIRLAKEAADLGVLNHNPTLSRQANVSLAQAYLHAGKLELAATAVEAAIDKPIGIRALGSWVTYGLVLFRLNEIDQARAAFHRACTEAWLRLEREPREYQTHEAAGLTLCGLALCKEPDRIHRAVEAYHQARRLAPVDGAKQQALTHLQLFGSADPVILNQARRAAEDRTPK
ncbi:TIR domain-containing protein [Nonomuraea sp. NPDC049784]|uniref:TIR domain-containing protein n=1 Tax=Nonomuraea sp. NPDC049784 TaxID=3154361 RepID=UPI0033D31B28